MSAAKRLASEITAYGSIPAVNKEHPRLTGYCVAFVRRNGEARSISFGTHERGKAQECYNANVTCESTVYTALFIVTDDTGFIERDSYFG